MNSERDSERQRIFSLFIWRRSSGWHTSFVSIWCILLGSNDREEKTIWDHGGSCRRSFLDPRKLCGQISPSLAVFSRYKRMAKMDSVVPLPLTESFQKFKILLQVGIPDNRTIVQLRFNVGSEKRIESMRYKLTIRVRFLINVLYMTTEYKVD